MEGLVNYVGKVFYGVDGCVLFGYWFEGWNVVDFLIDVLEFCVWVVVVGYGNDGGMG